MNQTLSTHNSSPEFKRNVTPNGSTFLQNKDISKDKNPKKDFENLIGVYLASNPIMQNNYKNSEVEIRFGGVNRQGKPITKINYENVIKKLYSCGFQPENESGLQILRISNEYTDNKGMTKISNIRAELVGIDMIQEYCKSNSIQKVLDKTSSSIQSEFKIKFTQKTPAFSNDKLPLRPADFLDYDFRVSYKMEQDFTPNSNIAKNIINKWQDAKKIFRFINRVRFAHVDYPFFFDVSIVKGNKKVKKYIPVPHYTIQDAGVFDNVESYEIEIEVDNSRVGAGTPYNTTSKLLTSLRKGIRIVLGGLQGTHYPISLHEQNDVLQSYMKLLHGKDYQESRVTPRDFIGPSSVTLQIKNIMDDKDAVKTNIPNIRTHYTVTDKADGERKLLFISDNGRIYMIDTNMNVIFTGTMTNEKTLYNSILDGEHILFDKTGKFIHLYAAFDIYFVNSKNIRDFAFMKTESEEEQEEQGETKGGGYEGTRYEGTRYEGGKKEAGVKGEKKYRLMVLMKAMKLMKPFSVMDSGPVSETEHASNPCKFTIKNKEFFYSKDISIFQNCAKILSDIDDGIYQYNTDGLIFTPCNTGVGSDREGASAPLSKMTWDLSFKWKPPEFNTVDFLVSIRKDKNGKDEIHNVFQEGLNSTGLLNIVQYKTLVLRCGFSEKDHGFLNPTQNIIDDILPKPEDRENEDKYRPVPFQPTNPFDPQACFSNIFMTQSGSGDLLMKTQEGEYFEEDMIVEFQYNRDLESGWRWIPLRVRYDKTAELRSGRRNYGNAYHVANNIWHSIHNPVSKEIIASGLGLPEYIEDEDIYYNRYNKDSSTRGLRNFHNLYVKKKLICGVSNRKDILIDFAVGKAGDLSKWREARLEFVYGVDIAKDNIHNNLDGASARYLKEKRQFSELPSALFVVGNSSLNIRNGEAFTTDKEKMINKAVFGNGPKDRKVLGEGVYRHYGIANGGFNVSSCQFAMHYFFESIKTFHSFMKNVAECTAMGGYFIGTCYDGKKVFETLKPFQVDEGLVIMKGGKKIYELVKMYGETGFPDDETSLGYGINVFQESINKYFREYLVNFDYLVQIMEDYGFVLVQKEEANKMGLPDGTGLFDELFMQMKNDIRLNHRKTDDFGEAIKMTDEEKRISFLNRFFVFKKVRNIDTDKLRKILTQYGVMFDKSEEEYEDTHDATRFSTEMVKDSRKLDEKIEETQKKTIIRKIKKKMTLKNYAPVEEEEEPILPKITTQVPKKMRLKIVESFTE